MSVIFEIVSGSHLYGLSTPESDEDRGQVSVESKTQLLSYYPQREKLIQAEIGGFDSQRHYLKHFIDLASRANPNVLEWLYAPDSMIKLVHPAFKSLFLSDPSPFLGLERVVQSHLGFARDQLDKMITLNPKAGQARKDLVAKYGYDVKFAGHGMRLLLQLNMLLTTGKIVYPYPTDIHDQVMEIKRAKYSKDEFLRMFHDYARYLEASVISKSELPPEANHTELHKRLASFYEAYYWTLA